MDPQSDNLNPTRHAGTPMRARLANAVIFMLCGILFTSDMIAGEARNLDVAVSDVLPFVSKLVLAHAVGGAIAGFALANLIGRGGWFGWLLSIVGAVLVTLLGGAIGGLIATFPTVISSGVPFLQMLIGIGVGALTVPFAAGEVPSAVLFWIGAVILAYVVGRYVRLRHR